MKPGSVLLIRHAKAFGQAPKAELTADGLAQARALAEELAGLGITRIISSPWTRAVDTARPLAERLGLDIQTDKRLTERVLSGRDLPYWRTALKASFAVPGRKFPGGESGAEARGRIQAVLAEKTDPDGLTVMVTHGNLLALALGLGYDGWAGLHNPDVWVYAPGQPATRYGKGA